MDRVTYHAAGVKADLMDSVMCGFSCCREHRLTMHPEDVGRTEHNPCQPRHSNSVSKRGAHRMGRSTNLQSAWGQIGRFETALGMKELAKL